MGPIALALDMTVTLGNVIQTVVVLGGLLGLYIKLRERLREIEVKLAPLWDAFIRRRLEE